MATCCNTRAGWHCGVYFADAAGHSAGICRLIDGRMVRWLCQSERIHHRHHWAYRTISAYCWVCGFIYHRQKSGRQSIRTLGRGNWWISWLFCRAVRVDHWHRRRSRHWRTACEKRNQPSHCSWHCRRVRFCHCACCKSRAASHYAGNFCICVLRLIEAFIDALKTHKKATFKAQPFSMLWKPYK